MISILFIGSITLQCIAQEPVTDHPVLGRFQGSADYYQEISNYNEYTLVTGEFSEEEEAFVSTIPLEGKVWMSEYTGPENTSALEIYNAYKTMFETMGYEILYSCKGACGSDFAGAWYHLNGFASDRNYSRSIPIINGNDSYEHYLAAVNPDKTLYVAVFVAQGWWDYPVYKLDVIEVKKSNGGIISTGGEAPEPEPQETRKPVDAGKSQVAQEKVPVSTGAASDQMIRIRAGVSGFAPLDQNLYGYQNFFETSGTGGVPRFPQGLSGWGYAGGAFADVSYMLNGNVGVSAGAALHSIEHDLNYGSYSAESSAQFSFVSAGFTGSITGADAPVTISASIRGGLMIASLYYFEADTSVPGSEVFLEHDGIHPGFSYSTAVSIPVIGPVSIFGEYAFDFIPVDELVLEHSGGSDYSFTFEEVNLGGSNFRVGLQVGF